MFNRHQKLPQISAKKFIYTGTRYLSQTFPDKSSNLSPIELQNKFIDDCIFAEHFGFTSEADVMTIVDFKWRYDKELNFSDNNEESKWVFDILSDDHLNNSEKIDHLHNSLAIIIAAEE